MKIILSCLIVSIFFFNVTQAREPVGCTAMAQADLELLLGWLDPERKPLLVQLPAAQYQKLRHRWNLPEINAPAAAGDTTMQSGPKSVGKD